MTDRMRACEIELVNMDSPSKGLQPIKTLEIETDEVSSPSFKNLTLPEQVMRVSQSELRVVSLPLLFLGIPAHLIHLNDQSIGNTMQWIKSLTQSPASLTMLTLIVGIVALVLDIYIVQNFTQLLYLVVVKGQLNWRTLDDIVDVVHCLPVLIPVNFLWIKGYVIRNLILKFTAPDSHSESLVLNPHLLQGRWRHESLDDPDPVESYRIKLIGMYSMIVFVHLTHFWLYAGVRLPLNSVSTTVSVEKHFVNYLIGPMFCTLMLPVYVTWCWACRRQFEIVNIYLNYFVSVNELGMAHFHRFKASFRELTNRIQQVNEIYEFYISFVLLWIRLSIVLVEVHDLQSILRLNTTLFYDLVGSQLGLNVSTATMNEAEAEAENELPTSAVVRIVIFGTTSIFLKWWLIHQTVLEAAGTNDAIRDMGVCLNDLVTRPRAKMPVSRYIAFRLLKSYVHSRLQEPLPAVMRISSFWGVTPSSAQKSLHPVPAGQYD